MMCIEARGRPAAIGGLLSAWMLLSSLTAGAEGLTDELAAAVGGEVTRDSFEESRDRFEQGGLSPSIAGEEVVGSVLEGNVLGNFGKEGTVSNAKSLGEFHRSLVIGIAAGIHDGGGVTAFPH